MMFFKLAQQETRYLGYFSNTICHQEIKKSPKLVTLPPIHIFVQHDIVSRPVCVTFNYDDDDDDDDDDDGYCNLFFKYFISTSY